ncbi:MAG TPA: AzlC family ABC transporter permease [Motilibacteraceae bacterium]|nr:AzlC family ABC transporter permease [Motilibacteraceae bacterium]
MSQSLLTDEHAPARASREDLWDGVRAMAPMLLAYAPLGLVVGAAVAASANPLAAWLSTWTIYSGAAHLAVLDVLAHGSGWSAAAVAGLLVNARLSAYATDLAPEWATAPVWHRIAAALMVTEAPWALSRGRESGRRAFYVGAGLTLFVGWPTLVTTGVLTGSWLSGAPVTGLLPALTLGAVVVRQLRDRPVAVAAAATAVSAVATVRLSAGVAMGVAAVVGAVAALAAERAS